MTQHRAPADVIGFCLESVAGCIPAGAAGDDARAELGALLEEAGRFAERVIAPLNRDSDRIGPRFVDGVVTLSPGFPEAYRQLCAGGWMSAVAPRAIGGMGLAHSTGAALSELWHFGSMSFAMGLVLTQAAVELLDRHGSAELREAYLPNLVTGEWTGTMCLTEPQAGSDLGRITTRAEPAPDCAFRISGQKSFISYGEHDLSDNIVHMVLARLPDAPAGVHGLSLFLCPKQLPGGQRNAVHCIGIERKMGLHGSPTCSLRFEAAHAWLVGEPHQGLAAMFTMMNAARLNTGLQGSAVGEAATQQALAYARQRIQGRSPTGADATLDMHPDVRRMLLDMAASTMAARCVSYFAAAALDRSHADPVAEAEAALLTPIVKAYGSDLGCAVASLGLQVHGGSGYVEETGAAQHFRDIRIAPIYEGANGLQAIDLLLRKIVRAGPQTATRLLERLAPICAAAASNASLRPSADLARQSIASTLSAIDWMSARDRREQDRLWGATPFLKLMGQTVAGALLLKGAMSPGSARFPQPQNFPALAVFFARNHLVHSPALAAQACSPAAEVDAALGLDLLR